LTVLKSEQEILNDIHGKLSQIYDLLYGVIKERNQPEQGPGVLVHESRGTCPACDSADVTLAFRDTFRKEYPIYQCNTCEQVWVNDEAALLQY